MDNDGNISVKINTWIWVSILFVNGVGLVSNFVYYGHQPRKIIP